MQGRTVTDLDLRRDRLGSVLGKDGACVGFGPSKAGLGPVHVYGD